jgi:hypothetical protein
VEVSLYMRWAGSQLGSSALFGGVMFAGTLPSDGLQEAAIVGLTAAAAWIATLPLLKRLVTGIAGA